MRARARASASALQRFTGLALLVLAAPAGVGAEQGPPVGAQAAPPVRAEQATTPPAVISVPALDLPADLEVTEAQLDVEVQIDPQGEASLPEGQLSGGLREAVERALAAGRFEPARSAGVAVSARVTLRFELASVPVADGGTAPAVAANAGAGEEPSAGAAPQEPVAYGARAEVPAPKPTARRLELVAMRDVPGAFGDPFRILDTLPGVVPILTGVPYVYVRGAPPAGTIYLYDGIPVPALFHLALGPAVVHPALVGDLDFYSAVAPARYGRHTGGVFAGQGRGQAGTDVAGELELRLVDVQAMLDIPVGGGRVTVAGRYGYPGLLLTLLSSEAELSYWDYQLRVTQRLSASDRAELLIFGSYDRVGEKDDPQEGLSLQFHRAEARLLRTQRRLELGAALQVGYEQSQLADELRVSAIRLGPRLWFGAAPTSGVRLRVGADLLGTFGEVTELDDALQPAFSEPDVAPATGGPTQARGLPPRMSSSQGFEPQEEFGDPPLTNPLYTAVAGRSVAGAYAQAALQLGDSLQIEPGLRADIWMTGSRSQVAVEPRLLLTYRLAESWTAHVAAGLGHQPATAPIPLPGFADVALDQGLQRATKLEAGVAADPYDFLHIESQLFFNHMENLMLLDLAFDCDQLELDPSCELLIPRADVDAYGIEAFLKVPSRYRVSGWLSYTLGFARGHTLGGRRFTPSFDIRHVGNLVASVDLGGGFSAGTRLHYSSGKMATAGVDVVVAGRQPVSQRQEFRLPGFFRADLKLAYGWSPSWGRMRVTLEWLNATLSEEAVDVSCESTPDGLGVDQCEVEYAPAIFFPNLGVRAEF